MKILHTSDWHLGHLLYGYERTEEQKSMLRQMADIVREEKPDVFIIAGDIFHVGRPSASVQKMFVDSLTDICSENKDMKIILTAGNHDSGAMHEVFRTPWKILGVEAIGTLSSDDPSTHIIELPGKGFVIAIPYVSERFLPDDFIQKVIDLTKKKNKDNLPIIMTAHTTVKGAAFEGHEKIGDWLIGGIDGVELKEMGVGYDYLALGHIHHGQFIHSGKHNVRYSGAPLPVNFDENYVHTLSIVEIERHGETPKVRQIEILNPIPLVTLPASGSADWSSVIELLRGFPKDKKAYIRLNVEQTAPLLPNAADEAANLVKDKECRFCLINYKKRISGVSDETNKFTIREFKEIDPLEIAGRYIESQGDEFDDSMAEMFKEALNQVKKELSR